MKKMNYFLKYLFIIAIIFSSQWGYAEEVNVNLTLKNNGVVIFNGVLPLPAEGAIDINDSDGNPHSINVRSTLNIINEADTLSSDFNISGLIYYASFNAFYLKCITLVEQAPLCDDWQYKVNDIDPGVGMDQNVLSGGENIVLFFGTENPKPIPVEVPEEVKPPVQYTFYAGGHYRPPNPPISPILPTETMIVPQIEQPIILEVANKIVLMPNETIKKVTTKQITKKLVVKTVASTTSNLGVKNEAAVIVATQDNRINIRSEEKKSWIRNFLSWLFGF